jgi:hypothetical protein
MVPRCFFLSDFAEDNSLTMGTVARRVVVFRQEASPTDELYILNPLKRWVDARELDLEIVTFKNEGFSETRAKMMLTPGTVVIVCRYISSKWLDVLANYKNHLGRVIYLMDDDLLAAQDTCSLPLAYRDRMRRIAYGQFQNLLNLCHTFVVTSEHLRKRYDSPKTRLLRPSFVPDSLSDRSAEDADETIRIAYHGTGGHRHDIAMLAPMLTEFLETHKNIRMDFTTAEVPSLLRQHKRVSLTKPMVWEEYKVHRTQRRAHIALAPMLRSAYNQGKSFIKLLDVAQIGAVGVYSIHPEFTEYVRHEHDGLLLENDPKLWRKGLEWLVQDPERLATLRENALQLANRVGHMGRLEEFWANELQIALPSSGVKGNE